MMRSSLAEGSLYTRSHTPDSADEMLLMRDSIPHLLFFLPCAQGTVACEQWNVAVFEPKNS